MDEIAKIKASLEARIKELNFVDSRLTDLLEMMSGRGGKQLYRGSSRTNPRTHLREGKLAQGRVAQEQCKLREVRGPLYSHRN